MPTKKRLTAAELRRRAEWEVEIEDGFTVRVRRIDMIGAYMQGVIPLPLMAALDRLRNQHAKLEADPLAILDVPSEDKAATIDLLQRYACKAIIDPIFVLDADYARNPNPDHCPISMLSAAQLMRVWQSGPDKPVSEVTPADATEFRVAAEPPQAPVAVSNVAQVPAAPERVFDGGAIVDFQYL